LDLDFEEARNARLAAEGTREKTPNCSKPTAGLMKNLFAAASASLCRYYFCRLDYF
jgi:hypothetical protein